MDAKTRLQVMERAGSRCEYCRFKQVHLPLQTFHLEHVIAVQHRGTADLSNLALSCTRCNAFKGTNLTSRDPDTDLVELLFNPRTQSWDEHFRVQEARIVGLTPVGRTTVWLLQMNASERVDLRALLIEDGDWD